MQKPRKPAAKKPEPIETGTVPPPKSRSESARNNAKATPPPLKEKASPEADKAAKKAPSSDAAPETDLLLEQTREQLLRALAETDNLRKRTQKEVQEARQYAVESFAQDLLSVPDNLSRALEALSIEDRNNLSEAGVKLLDGIEMTRKNLYTVLERNGLSPIAADPGCPFDPEQHQAVSHLPSPFPQGTIAQSFQTGWRLRGRVLRAAMVVVSAGAAQPDLPRVPGTPDPKASRPGGSLDIDV